MSPHVVVVAHHCNPAWGSEPQIGWKWARGLARRTRVTLVTHVRNRAAITAAGGLPAEIRYVDTERLARVVNAVNAKLWSPAAVVNRSFLESLALSAFDREATRIARSLAARGDADLVHRVSPLSPRAPSRLGTVGLPFVLGPLNGGMETAPGFDDVDRAERSAIQRLRPLARLLDPSGSTYRRADAILAATRTTLGAIPARDRARAEIVCENAVDLPAFIPVFERSGPVLSALYAGRLLPYKGVEYAIRAVCSLPEEVPVRLDIVGDGPDRARLEGIARGIDGLGRVRFHGAVPFDDVPGVMRRSDVLLLPSVRESGGAVVLEAMASGKPVVVADHGGPAETVVPGVGVRIAARSPGEMIAGVREALLRYATDEPLREREGRAARRHVAAEYTWDGKIERALALYERVLSAHGLRTGGARGTRATAPRVA